MGLHRDGELLGLPPFETEMRRRIWWQIILIDTVYALMSGLGQSLLPRSWDTRQPNNIHDADLYPTMTTLQPRNGPTDMIYCLVCYEMAKMMMDTPNLETVVLGNEVSGLVFQSPFYLSREKELSDSNLARPISHTVPELSINVSMHSKINS